jgi:hypothetical protein
MGSPIAVVVDGRFLKRDGKLTTIDMAQLARDAADTIERARKERARKARTRGSTSCLLVNLKVKREKSVCALTSRRDGTMPTAGS